MDKEPGKVHNISTTEECLTMSLKIDATMKKILAVLLCIIIFTPYEYLASELVKHLFVSGYYSALSFIEVWGFCIIFSSITILLILLFSFLIRNQAVNNSIQKIGLKMDYYAL
jgi:hypothetical protein